MYTSKTNIQAFLCFEIKGKFRSSEIYISFKKVEIFKNSLPSKLFQQCTYNVHSETLPLGIVIEYCNYRK